MLLIPWLSTLRLNLQPSFSSQPGPQHHHPHRHLSLHARMSFPPSLIPFHPRGHDRQRIACCSQRLA